MADRLVLTDKQAATVARIVSEPTHAALLGSDGGTGKTVVAVEAVRELGARTALVITPLNTFDGWITTFTRQDLGLPIRTITAQDGSAFELLAQDTPGVYLVGREFFYLSATDAPKREDGTRARTARWRWSRTHPDIVVLDEAHSAKSRWGLMSRTLRTIKPGFRLMMSATPAGNKFKGIWAPCRWLWPDTRNANGDLIVDNSQWRWAAQYANVEYDPWSGKKIMDEREPGAFVASLPCYIRDEREPIPTETRKVRIELSPAQSEQFESMKKDAIAWLGDHPLVADLPIVQKTRMRQIALGEVSFDEAGEVVFADDCASAKADACRTIITKHHPNDSILFFTDSAKFARVLAKRLPGAVSWTGELTKREREQVKSDFLSGKVKRLVATIQSIGEGVDMLQSVCHTEVWLNKSFNRILNEQCSFRINREGQRADKIISYELFSKQADEDEFFAKLVADTNTMKMTLKGGN